MSLAEALERAASALPKHAAAIRPANGDPQRLLAALEPDAAGAVLAWLLGHELDAADQLAGAWAEEPEGAAALERIPEAPLSKGGRKVLRRALHRLRSRGVALARPRGEPTVARLPALDEALDDASLTGLDPLGTRILHLIESQPGGGVRIFELLLDEQRGVLECEVYAANRSQARRFRREMKGHERFPAVDVTPAAARALIARVAAIHPADRPLPRAFVEWRSRLVDAPTGTATPGELAREALGDEPLPERVAAAAELVRTGELGPWPPPEPALRAAAERIGESRNLKIIVSEHQKREQVERAIGEGIAELVDAAALERLARQLEESAYVLWKGGRDDDARACLAAARDARERPAGESPVVRALVEIALRPALEALEREEQEAESSSLLVKP